MTTTSSRSRWRPAIYDLTAHFEPSAHFEYNRKKRRQFDDLAKRYKDSTWMLGSYGGKPQMRTDLQGIGVATRIEVGRLAWGQAQRQRQLARAFDLFQEAQKADLASGPVQRVLARFHRAAHRPEERQLVRQAWIEAFGGEECTFLGIDDDQVELGQCVSYQPLGQYLREDGIYHRVHRSRIEELGRHLQEEVGRYENHRFFVHPQGETEGVPGIEFGYTGEAADVAIEAFVAGYTGEKLVFWSPEDFAQSRSSFVSLKDYERASRRFGGLWILIGDMVKRLTAEQMALLYLFLDGDQRPLAQPLSWGELVHRQGESEHIGRSLRQSATYLETCLEGLQRLGLVFQVQEGYALGPDFEQVQQVYFYPLGEFRKRVL
ncbi:MAG: hypothetical protein GKR89_27640 [Candidatus Latescibacteria bacterium]|nr:hypothetical protein [Candidatus Latescibacterota bacterium]